MYVKLGIENKKSTFKWRTCGDRKRGEENATSPRDFHDLIDFTSSRIEMDCEFVYAGYIYRDVDEVAYSSPFSKLSSLFINNFLKNK